jgi:hypothetical protein
MMKENAHFMTSRKQREREDRAKFAIFPSTANDLTSSNEVPPPKGSTTSQ